MNTDHDKPILPLRHWFSRLPIKRKVVLLISFVSLLVAIVALVGSFFVELSFFRSKLLDDHQISARIIATNIEASMVFEDETDAREILGSLVERNAVLKAAAYLENKYLLATYLRPDLPPNEPPPLYNQTTGIQGNNITIDQPVTHQGQEIGKIVITTDLGELDAFLLTRFQLLFGLFIVIAAIAIFLAARIGEMLSRPILELARTADRISKEKDYSIRQKQLAADETGTLVNAFNNMIEEIKRREDELLAAKENAEASNKAKSDFLSVISHELRTPLNPIIGYVDVLQHKRFESDEKTKLLLVKQYAEHLQGLIDDIIDYSRIERGVFSIEKNAVNYQSLCDDAIDLLDEAASEKGLELSVQHEVDPAISKCAFIESDEVRLRQVLLNLVSNAIKFTTEGSIVVKTLLRPREAELELRLEVTDSGIGIPAGKEKDVFEPFHQLEDSLTRKHSGMGLGLAITRKIVAAMEGEIGFESEAGKGTRFWIDLPTRETTPPEKAQGSRKNLSGTKARVLLVDDQLVNRELGRFLLSEHGLDVVCANDGYHALEISEKQPFDLIIMDIKMPGMSGFDTSRAIRKMEAEHGRRTPIIALTAHVTAGGFEDYEDAGMDDLLAKPFSIEKLDIVLQRWLT